MSDEYLQRRGRDTTLEMAALRLLQAIQRLGESVPGEKITYFEASPIKSDECCRRWVALNDAGKLVKDVLANRKASESSAEGEQA